MDGGFGKQRSNGRFAAALVAQLYKAAISYQLGYPFTRKGIRPLRLAYDGAVDLPWSNAYSEELRNGFVLIPEETIDGKPCWVWKTRNGA